MLSKFPLLILVWLLCFGYSELHAQSFYNWKRDRKLTLGLGLGTTNYYGELRNTARVLNFNPDVAINVEYPLSPRLNARAEFTFYQIEGADNEYEGDSWAQSRYRRNLSFRANNFELSTFAVLSLFKDNIKYYQRSSFNPYVLAGIGVTTVNPKAFYQGEWYKLRDIQTEGVDYSAFALVIPFGAGVKYKITNDFNIALEAVYRFTFTDYLDDISTVYIDQSNFNGNRVHEILADRRQELDLDPVEAGTLRGNPDRNDGYFILSIKGSYYLPTSEWLRRWGSRKSKRLR